MTLIPTPAQRQAIEAPLGPVLVVAGPGAGKTFCLIARIGHLVGRVGIAPRRICAVTFTNKAADEIAQRLRRDLGIAADEVTRGTLHALCLMLLRDYGSAVGLRRGFGVADEDYQFRLLRRLRVRPERHGQVLTLFGRHRLQHTPLTPGDLELFRAYREALRSRNLVDYDDLIALAGELLRCHPAVAREVRERWDCILVDEFQDLSIGQYEVVTSLADAHRNCFAVGDDEQSIFSWAGADPAILERFRDDFGIERPIVLDRNRRCSRQIFDVARTLVGRNPALFDKQLEAERDSEHCVTAYTFPDDDAETAWLIGDLLRDRAESGLDWGEYAVLYRAHRVGQRLETRLIEAGIPCRMAKGHALADDEVIGGVLAALRVIRAPDDPLAIEALAERVLPRALLHRVQASHRGVELMTALRDFARGAARGDGDARIAWRFVYQVENLVALGRTHDSLAPLVDDLLAQRIGQYRNPLDERAAELTDPAAIPEAVELAGRIARAAARGATAWIEPDRGLEIPYMRMVHAVLGGVVRRLRCGDRPGPDDLVIRAGTVRPLVLFKALQLAHCRELADPLQDYVAFDLETTDLDAAECEIVEIAAVRVRGRVIVEQFHRLVRPDRPISPRATAVHGYHDEDVSEQPRFPEIWAEFRAFVGNDVLVAHNGQAFDVSVLRRLAHGLLGADDLTFLDTLPLARSLVDGSARLEHLAERFGVAKGRAHHALDDAGTLAGVLRALGDLRLERARKSALVNLLGWLGLALALENAAEPGAEERVLREVSLPATVGRFGGCLEAYQDEWRGTRGPKPEELIERLGGPRVVERLRTERSPAERYPESVARLGALVAGSAAPTLAEGIDRLLERIALSRSDGAPTDDGRVNLLTLHSTKGLEFSRVYIVGVEDGQLPGLIALERDNQREIQEMRRLLYVGMTRAKDRLVLTSADVRDGRPAGGRLFLREAGLDPIRP